MVYYTFIGLLVYPNDDLSFSILPFHLLQFAIDWARIRWDRIAISMYRKQQYSAISNDNKNVNSAIYLLVVERQ